MVDTCLVTGTLTDAGGVGLAGQTISIKPNNIMTSGPGAILPDEVFVVTGAGGSFSGSFVPGLYRMTWWHEYREYWTAFIVPDMEAATLRQVVDGANGIHSIPMPGPRGEKGEQGIPGQVGPGALNPTNSGYTSRAGFVAAVTAGDLDDVPDGMVVLAAGLQYIKKVGSTVISDLNGWEPEGASTPDHMGAVGNGIADDTIAVNAAAALGSLVGDRTYRMTGPLSLPANAHVGKISLVLDKSNASTTRTTAVNIAKKVVRSEISLSSLTYGASTHTMNIVAGLSVDTLLHIRSDDVWADDGDQDVKQGQLVRVLSIAGNVVTFSPEVDDDYAAGFTIDVLEKQTVHIDGLKLRSTAAPGNLLTGIWVGGCLGVYINADIQGFGRDGMAIETCYQSTLEGRIRDADHASTGYGVTLYSSCQSTIVRAHTDSSRTGVTLGGELGPNRGTIIEGNYHNCFTSAINTKVAAKGVSVGAATCSGNINGGLGDGIRLRGTDLTVSGATVRGFGRYPVILSLYGKTTREKLRGTVTGVICPDARDVIVLQAGGSGTVGGFIAMGNQISFRDGLTSASKGAFNIRGTATGKLDNVIVTGNIIDNCPFNGVDARGHADNQIDNLVDDNNIVVLTASAISAGRTKFVRTNITSVMGRQSSQTDTSPLASLLPGGFGLGGNTPGYPSGDLNTAGVPTGFYYTSTASNRPSLPTATGFFVLNIRFDANTATQLAVPPSSGQAGSFCVRTQSGGTWGGWQYPNMRGSASPEGLASAPIGTIFINTSGGSGTTLYVKESGTGNTGWVAK